MKRRTLLFSVGVALGVAMVAGLSARAVALEDEILREAEGGESSGSGSARDRLAGIVKQRAISDQARFAKADGLYRAGLKCYEEWQYEKAMRLFERAVETYPNHPKAQEYLRKTRAILDVHKDKAAVALEELSKAKRVKIQELLIEIGNGIYRAKKRWQAAQAYVPDTDAVAPKEELYSRAIENYGKCMEQCDRILEIIRWMPYRMDLSGARATAREMRNAAEQAMASKKSELATFQRSQAFKKAKQSKFQELHFRAERLNKLLGQARRFFDKRQYAEAERMSMQILALDPLNGEAQALKLKSRQKKHVQQEAKTWAEKRHETTGSQLAVEQAGIPYSRRIVYPDRWEQILARSEKGAIGIAEEPSWMKQIRAKLDRKVSFEFVDTPLSEAINFLQTLTHVNMIIDPRATGGGADVPINLKVSDMSLGLALEWILKLAELDYALKDNAIFISKPQRLLGEVELRIYDVRDLTEPELDKKAEVRWPEVTAATLAEMIQSRVMPETWAAELGTSIEDREGRLVVMQRPRVHRLIDKLIASYRDRQSLQVIVSSTWGTVTDEFLEEIGVQFADLDGPKKK